MTRINEAAWQESCRRLSLEGIDFITSGWSKDLDQSIEEEDMCMSMTVKDCLSSLIYSELFGYTNSDSKELDDISMALCGIIGEVIRHLKQSNLAVQPKDTILAAKWFNGLDNITVL